MPINHERITALCDALESGAYEQAQGKLRKVVDEKNNVIGFCCLGVACEISKLGEWCRTGSLKGVFRYNDPYGFTEDAELPRAVREYYDFANATGKSTRPIYDEEFGLGYRHSNGEQEGEFVELVDLNDNRHWDLPKIGRFLRKHMDSF